MNGWGEMRGSGREDELRGIQGDRARAPEHAAAGALGLPIGDPAHYGFAPDRLASAMVVLEDGLQVRAYPGAVALVVRRGTIVATAALGHAELAPDPRPMSLSTVFDLASVTKVMAGVTAALVLLDAGVLVLDDPVARFLPAFAADGKGEISIRHLLTHSSGLAPWLPCYTAARTADETFASLCSVELEARPGTQVQYSDLGMILIRAVVCAATGQDLPELLERAVFAPLGLRDTAYLPDEARRLRAAATEEGNRWEQGMVERAGLRFEGWRTGVLVGEVHDGNAHYALGGISSHAGLFSTAGDLARFAQLYLQQGVWDGRSLLSRAAIAEATRLQTSGLQAAYGLGWRLAEHPLQPPAPLARSARTQAIFPEDPAAGPRSSSFGDLLPASTFGHTGFTGTAITICPALDLALILLTNRVHPDAARRGIERIRARWHNAIAASILD